MEICFFYLANLIGGILSPEEGKNLASKTLCGFVKYSVMMEEVLENANDSKYWSKCCYQGNIMLYNGSYFDTN
jgi:hypothetical protein